MTNRVTPEELRVRQKERSLASAWEPRLWHEAEDDLDAAITAWEADRALLEMRKEVLLRAWRSRRVDELEAELARLRGLVQRFLDGHATVSALQDALTKENNYYLTSEEMRALNELMENNDE